MSSGIFISEIGKGTIQVPRRDQEFVEQATRPIYEVLGLEETNCCTHIKWLEKDHKGIVEMCRKALVPVIIKKTNQEYLYSMLTFAAIAAGVGLAFTYLKSGSLKAHLIIAAVLGLGGMIVGLVRAYSGPEENMKKTEIVLKATTEKNWLRSKLDQITEKLTAAEGEIAKFSLEDFDKEEKKDTLALRDQLLLLKSYVTTAVGSKHG